MTVLHVKSISQVFFSKVTSFINEELDTAIQARLHQLVLRKHLLINSPDNGAMLLLICLTFQRKFANEKRNVEPNETFNGTRKHSSRMRNARLQTVGASVATSRCQ